MKGTTRVPKEMKLFRVVKGTISLAKVTAMSNPTFQMMVLGTGGEFIIEDER